MRVVYDVAHGELWRAAIHRQGQNWLEARIHDPLIGELSVGLRNRPSEGGTRVTATYGWSVPTLRILRNDEIHIVPNAIAELLADPAYPIQPGG